MSEEPVDITQQAAAPTPTTAAPRTKNPKRVAAGKAIAEKTRQAREAQKKTLAKAVAIIANDEAKKKTDQSPRRSLPFQSPSMQTSLKGLSIGASARPNG